MGLKYSLYKTDLPSYVVHDAFLVTKQAFKA